MIDVVEIDAASYTGVDNIREIIEHAQFTPTQGKYKVYIIDEVHMLSKGAFNALLKTLEEPPAHVIFLLATTEIHKVPDTVLSRVIRFDLERIGEWDMNKHLWNICAQENIAAENEAIQMITYRARGSLRDALTILEKCIYDNAITTDYVEKALHLVNHRFLRETFEACKSGEAKKIQDVLNTLIQEGTDVRQFASQMTEWIVENIGESFEKKDFPTYKAIFDTFTRVFIQCRQVAVPMDILRMALYEMIREGKIESRKQTLETTDTPKIKVASSQIPTEIHVLGKPEHELPQPKKEIPSGTEQDKMENKSTTISEINTKKDRVDQNFSLQNYLAKIQTSKIKPTLLPLLRTAAMEIKDGMLIITTTAFAKKMCEEPNAWSILTESALYFGAEKIEIRDIDNANSDTNTQKNMNVIDMATSLFE